jgi:hypothetical protein
VLGRKLTRYITAMHVGWKGPGVDRHRGLPLSALAQIFKVWSQPSETESLDVDLKSVFNELTV